MGPHSPSTRSHLAVFLLSLATALFGCATYSDDYDDYDDYYGHGYHRYERHRYSYYGRPYPVYVPVYRDDRNRHHRHHDDHGGGDHRQAGESRHHREQVQRNDDAPAPRADRHEARTDARAARATRGDQLRVEPFDRSTGR